MRNWSFETQRTLTETAYWRDYRHASGERGTWLDFKCDILEPLIEAELSGGPEVSVCGDWLERFAVGRWHKDSGEYYYTAPGKERLGLITRYLQRSGFILPLILMDHEADIVEACSIRDQKGYRFANQKLLAGTFRGAFSGMAETDYGIYEAAAFLCFIPGEDLFRVRLIQTHYFDEDASGNSLKDRFASIGFNGWFVTDLFASFGTDEGRIFGGAISHDGFSADDFEFISKGRRVSAFTLSDSRGLQASMRMELCRKPDAINRMLDTCKAVWTARQQPLAAE